MNKLPVLPPASPESVGVSPERLERLRQVLNREIAQHKLPGAVLTIARRGQLVCHEALGRRDPARDEPMPKDALFRIYSMTKPIVSVAVMTLVEQGRLLLSQPVASHLPELASLQVSVMHEGRPELRPLARPVTVQDLLRHTAGFTYQFMGNTPIHRRYADEGLFDRRLNNAEFITTLAGIPLLRQPGAAWGYSAATDVLGRLIEVVTGTSLGAYLQSAVFAPLGMVDTGFFVPEAHWSRLAEAYPNDPDSGAPIELFDVRQPVPQEMGGAGLVSTAADYARFMQMMLNGGDLGGVRVLGPKTVRLMSSDHLGAIPVAGDLLPSGYGFGLGFGVRLHDGVAPGAGSAGMYYWAGLSGTSFFIDPKEQLHAQLMLQQPGRRDHYRLLFRELVYAALMD